MRIYAVADIHADAEKIGIIRANIAEHDPDVLVIAGDILNYIRRQQVFGSLNALPIPVLAIRGNSDPFWHERVFNRYENITSLHLKRIELGGVPFAGIGGAIPVPFRTRFRFFERFLIEHVRKLVDSSTILVVHPPPRGVLDRVIGRFPAGSAGVSRLLAGCRPKVIICGHIHEDGGARFVENSLVVNCSMSETARGALIELDGMRGPEVRML